jgi:ATP-dependent exoDNAse (exonuclease V) beta subunit
MSILFIPDGHRYIHEESGKELQSVTQFISEFFEKFDTERWSAHIALRDNLTVKQVLDMWEKKKDDSCDFGKLVHSYAESLIRGSKKVIPSNKAERMYFSAVNDFMRSEKHEFIEAEKVIGSPLYGIAGQVDAISRTKKGMCIIDWKTNKSIDLAGYNDRRCQRPIDHLQECNYSRYSLQLSLYRYILELEYGFKISGQLLIHLRPDGKYERYETDYLKDEIESMLAYTGRL